MSEQRLTGSHSVYLETCGRVVHLLGYSAIIAEDNNCSNRCPYLNVVHWDIYICGAFSTKKHPNRSQPLTVSIQGSSIKTERCPQCIEMMNTINKK